MHEPVERAGPFPVHVPERDSSLVSIVLPGSAIVGFPLPSDPQVVHVYYEGNRYRREALRRFADRAKFAAGRCRWFRFDPDRWAREHPGEAAPLVEHGWVGYPTTAQYLVPAKELITVATYDDELGLVVPLGLDQERRLRAWIGPVADETLDLQATGSEFERRRASPRDGPAASG